MVYMNYMSCNECIYFYLVLGSWSNRIVSHLVVYGFIAVSNRANIK